MTSTCLEVGAKPHRLRGLCFAQAARINPILSISALTLLFAGDSAQIRFRNVRFYARLMLQKGSLGIAAYIEVSVCITQKQLAVALIPEAGITVSAGAEVNFG